MARKLTVKQRKFADEYIISGNATLAAEKAGYSKNTARQIGNENLTKPYIRNYIKERTDKLESEKIADMTEVRQLWTAIMRDKEEKASDRLKASELMAKTKGAFLDRIEMSGEINNKSPYDELSVEELKLLAKECELNDKT